MNAKSENIELNSARIGKIQVEVLKILLKMSVPITFYVLIKRWELRPLHLPQYPFFNYTHIKSNTSIRLITTINGNYFITYIILNYE